MSTCSIQMDSPSLGGHVTPPVSPFSSSPPVILSLAAHVRLSTCPKLKREDSAWKKSTVCPVDASPREKCKNVF